jgi:hypothetical protein
MALDRFQTPGRYSPKSSGVGPIAARAAQSDGVVKNFADGRNNPSIHAEGWWGDGDWGLAAINNRLAVSPYFQTIAKLPFYGHIFKNYCQPAAVHTGYL